MFYDDPKWENVSPHTDKYGTKSGVFVYKNGIRQDIIVKIPSKEEPKVPKDETIFNVKNDHCVEEKEEEI